MSAYRIDSMGKICNQDGVEMDAWAVVSRLNELKNQRDAVWMRGAESLRWGYIYNVSHMPIPLNNPPLLSGERGSVRADLYRLLTEAEKAFESLSACCKNPEVVDSSAGGKTFRYCRNCKSEVQ